jgi:hypothetical protein
MPEASQDTCLKPQVLSWNRTRTKERTGRLEEEEVPLSLVSTFSLPPLSFQSSVNFPPDPRVQARPGQRQLGLVRAWRRRVQVGTDPGQQSGKAEQSR